MPANPATDGISNDWGRWDGSPYNQAKDVYINSVGRITNAPVGFSPTIAFAGFRAKRGNSTQLYAPNDGDVDNFVVTLSTQ